MMKELAVVFVLLTVLSALIAASSTAKAVTEVQTVAKIELIPNAASVGLAVMVNMSVSPSPPTTTDLLHGLKVKIVRPDGSLQNHTVIGFGGQQATFNYFGPYITDGNGTTWFLFVPTMIGTYMVQLEYPGEYFVSNTIRYMPSNSMVANLVVQPEPLPSQNSPNPSPSVLPAPSPTPTPQPSKKLSRIIILSSSIAMSLGTAIVLKGTIVDDASGAPITSVPVKLSAVDPNGNSLFIGSVNSDVSGAFSITWIPVVPGEYTVIVNFEGSQTYTNASSGIHLVVNPSETPIETFNPALSPTPTQSASESPVATSYLTPIATIQTNTQTPPQAPPNMVTLAIVAAMAALIVSLIVLLTRLVRKR